MTHCAAGAHASIYLAVLHLLSHCVSSLLRVRTEGCALQMMGAKDDEGDALGTEAGAR